MNISTYQGSIASLYELENKNGMKVTLTDIGASIVDIIVPDKDSNPVDVNLGYAGPEGYFKNHACYGATVGRIANRIRNAQFTLNGITYNLDKNKGEHTLHSGFSKYFHRMWYAEPSKDKESVTFKLISPDGDQGMPGRALISVTFSLDEDNRIIIDYSAVSDKDTYFNLTNHSYFNLNGHDTKDINAHTLWMDCGRFTPTDADLVPTGEILSVKDTPMDFTTEKTLAQDIESDYEQLKMAGGYDHNYILNNPGLEKPFAIVKGDKTGIILEAYTDLPGVQLYTGNSMGHDEGEKGGKYERRGAFCLETQFFPDTPNNPQFPSSLFEAGKELKTTTIFKFYA